MDSTLHDRLLLVLHHGLVEIRHFARTPESERVRHLADVLEVIPVYMSEWEPQCMRIIRSSFESYHQKWRPLFRDYLAILDGTDPR